MADRIAAARRAVADAADRTDESTVREQLHSIDEGLAAVADEPADVEQGDRFEELEDKLTDLGDTVEDETALERLEDARDHVDAYRRDETRDW